MIYNQLENSRNKLSVKALCELSGVSRSGYYSWLSAKDNPDSYQNKKELQDQKDFDLILQAYKHRGYDKGRRGIYMQLLHMGVVMNEKKISRLMKKYNLHCPIRKANPYRRMAKALKTSNYADNLLQRKFEEYGPGIVLLTDITYFFYGKDRKKAYLSVIKDAFTKQVLAHVLSSSLEIDFVLQTVNKLFENHKEDILSDALIHSDQGCHYTSVKFIELVRNKELRQSMSRRGNCWDNAPQESFFGHMKDEIGEYFKNIQEFNEMKSVIDDYIDYYNNDRYQYQLAKLSPNEFLEYYKTGKYPLKELINPPKDIEEKIWQIKKFREED